MSPVKPQTPEANLSAHKVQGPSIKVAVCHVFKVYCTLAVAHGTAQEALVCRRWMAQWEADHALCPMTLERENLFLCGDALVGVGRGERVSTI